MPENVYEMTGEAGKRLAQAVDAKMRSSKKAVLGREPYRRRPDEQLVAAMNAELEAFAEAIRSGDISPYGIRVFTGGLLTGSVHVLAGMVGVYSEPNRSFFATCPILERVPVDSKLARSMFEAVPEVAEWREKERRWEVQREAEKQETERRRAEAEAVIVPIHPGHEERAAQAAKHVRRIENCDDTAWASDDGKAEFRNSQAMARTRKEAFAALAGLPADTVGAIWLKYAWDKDHVPSLDEIVAMSTATPESSALSSNAAETCGAGEDVGDEQDTRFSFPSPW